MNKYKVGDKIVLTVSDVNEKAYYSYYVFNNNDLILWEPSTDKYAEPLSTYTEPLEAKINRQAAENTRLLEENKELKENFEKSKTINLNMGRLAGQNEAWELAKKCMLMTDREREIIFGSGHNALYGVLTYFDYNHAATKVAEWEKAKEEIKVGDVLEDVASSKVKCVVTNIYPSNMAYLVFSDGSAGIHELENMKKTGRHIDIDGFLKQIGGEE